MNLTTHIAVGSAVGLATGNPVAGFFAGFVSHHILDSMPHSDPGSTGMSIYDAFQSKYRDGLYWALGDVFVALIFFVIVITKSSFSPLIFWGATGAVLPDAIDNSPFWSPYLRKIFPFNYYHLLHEKLHYTIESKKYFWAGIFDQLILIAIAVYYLSVKLA